MTDEEHRIRAEHVLAGVTPAVLARLVGDPAPAVAPGAQVKVNLLLRRLPRLRDETVTPEQAFGGTFHINENYSQLDAAYTRAAGGAIPDPLPCEIYCHSLTDPSILSDELQAAGAQTLTVFGLHAPHSLATGADPDRLREDLTSAVLHSLNSVLAEPIQDVLMEDASGRLCIEAKTTQDLEWTLGMTAGNIFHGALSWPFAENDEPLDTPAQRWGVATASRADPVVRVRFSSRWRGVGSGRPQRRHGGTGLLTAGVRVCTRHAANSRQSVHARAAQGNSAAHSMWPS